jgi:hypothetical protein
VKEIHRELQRQAFSMIGTLRVFFPVRAKECKYVNKLAYIPSQDTLAGLRRVFEMEGGRIKQQLSTCFVLPTQDIEDGSEVDSNKRSIEIDSLTQLLVNSLIHPLSDSLMYDVENLNRRQAAAVLCYYIDPSQIVQDAVKSLIKSLKEKDIVKYLEVQMVALKSAFMDHVVNR